MSVADIRRLYYNSGSHEDIEKVYYATDVEEHDSDYYGATTLHLAAEYGEEGILSHLIENMDARVNEKDDRGYTPLMYAVESRNGMDEEKRGRIVSILMENGASISRSAKDTTALIAALRSRRLSSVEKMLSYASGQRIDGRNGSGENALHAAARTAGEISSDLRRAYSLKRRYEEEPWTSERSINDNLETIRKHEDEEERIISIMRTFIDSGLFDADSKTDSGYTAYEIAISSGSKRAGALLRGMEGEKALLHGGMDYFEALSLGDNVALLARIEENDLDPDAFCENGKLSDFKGKTALMSALFWRNLDAAKELLKAGADPNLRDLEDRSAFYYLFRSRNSSSLDKERLEAFLDMMISSGWLFDSPQDRFNSSSLSIVCSDSACDAAMMLFRYLVKKKSDINKCNDNGMSPAMRLFESRGYGDESVNMLEILLEKNADVSGVDNEGNTILHHIANTHNRNAAVKAVQLLKEFGFSPDADKVNNEGKSALDIATYWNNEDLIKEFV